MYTSIFGVRNCDLIWKNFILYSGGSNTVGTILPQCTKYLLGPRGWSPLGPVKYFVHFGNIISPYYYHPHIVNSYCCIDLDFPSVAYHWTLRRTDSKRSSLCPKNNLLSRLFFRHNRERIQIWNRSLLCQVRISLIRNNEERFQFWNHSLLCSKWDCICKFFFRHNGERFQSIKSLSLEEV